MAAGFEAYYGQRLEPDMPRRVPAAYRPNLRDLQYWLDEDRMANTHGGWHSCQPARDALTSRDFMDQLPREISDIILMYLIRWPDQMYYGRRRKWLAPLLLTAPILQVSRRLRQQGWDLIKIHTLWLRLTFHGTWHESVLRFDHMSTHLPPFIWRSLSDSRAVLSLDLSDPAEDNPRPRVPIHRSSIYPFSVDSFIALRNSFVLGPDGQTRSMTHHSFVMTCSVRDVQAFDLGRTLTVNLTVLPLLLGVSGWTFEEWDLLTDLPLPPREVQPTETIYPRTWKATHDLNRSPSDSHVHQTVLASNETLRKHAMHHAADLLVLDASYSKVPWLGLGGILVGDITAELRQSRKVLHRVEYEACLAYCRLASTCGAPWMIENERHLRNRWAQVLNHDIFGLSDIELSEVYHAQALIWRQYAVIDDLRIFWQTTRYAASVNQKSHHSFFRAGSSVPLRLMGQRARLPERQRSIDTDVANRMFFALHHQPDNVEFQKLYRETRPKNWDPLDSDMEPEEILLDRDIHAPKLKTADLGDGMEWVGAESLYLSWCVDGSDDCLRFADAGVRRRAGWSRATDDDNSVDDDSDIDIDSNSDNEDENWQ